MGNPISATLEFAIANLIRQRACTKLVDLNLSIQIAVYPKDAVKDAEDARLIRADTIGRLASQANQTLKSHLILDDSNVSQGWHDDQGVVFLGDIRLSIRQFIIAGPKR